MESELNKTKQPKQGFYDMYRPIHSGFIIHWTGKDIDDVHDEDWAIKHSSKTNQEVVIKRYIERLKNILEYGLWMTKKDEDKSVTVNNKTIIRPPVARTCFTELKLSEVRAHAARFGRLGIGVKRPFLFDRLGSPMCYFHPKRRNWFFEPYLSENDEGKIDDYYSCFLKQMGDEPPAGETWRFIYFDESEWRIIYSEDIRVLLLSKKRVDVVKLFENPRDKENKKYHDYYNTLTDETKPEYLIPLDAWFSMIIYPSLAVKNEAQDNEEIRELIKQIKKKDSIDSERKNDPVEVDLDACRNF